MEQESIVTHRDIAALVGCDKSTVSLALRGSPKIAEEMGRKIREAAKKLGYRPDPAIALLAKHRWARHKAGYRSTIAYLVDKKLGNYRLQKRHFASASARALERGYVLSEFDLAAYPSGSSASRVLFNRGIRGVIVPNMPREADVELKELELEKFTIVCCSFGWLRPPFHAVAPDVFEGTRRAWQEVAAKGYRRIGGALFRHNPVAVDDYARLGASFAASQELVAPRDRIPFHLGDTADEASFNEWYDRHRPEVIITFVQTVHQWLQNRGLSVPRDVALACLNVFPNTALSGISVQFDEVGRSAVDFLVAQIAENKRGVPASQQLLLLEPQWIEGTTLPPAGILRSGAGTTVAPRKRGKLAGVG